MKTIVFRASAAKQFDALPADMRDTVFEGIALYAITGQGDVKRLHGRDGFRLPASDRSLSRAVR